MNNNSNPMIASTLNHIRSLSIRRKSNQAATAGNHGGGGGSNGHHQPSSRKKSTDRTTRLLIVILVLFLITEFPQVSTYIYKKNNSLGPSRGPVASYVLINTFVFEVQHGMNFCTKPSHNIR